MNVVFRVDAANHIGSGHVMRCITLAKELNLSFNAQVTFICRGFSGHLISFISKQGFDTKELHCDVSAEKKPNHNEFLRSSYEDDAKATIELLPKDDSKLVDWLVVDHYGIDEKWEHLLRPYCQNIMVIDDLNDRKHSCDLILDQNHTTSKQRRYVDSSGKKLIGPKYALLREEFRLLDSPEHSNRNRKILVFFGGVDINNETLKALSGIAMLDLSNVDVDVDVILGQSNPHKADIEAFCHNRERFNLHIQVSDMAKRMAQSMLFVGAGGSTALERACCGLPSIVTAVAKNQMESSESLASIGVHLYLGTAEALTPKDYANAVQDMINNDSSLGKMTSCARKLVDGQGVSRVANIMKQISNEN